MYPHVSSHNITTREYTVLHPAITILPYLTLAGIVFSLTVAVPMADYDIFREQLAIKYPTYGHALWGPRPKKPDRPVQVGDVGFIRRGYFHRLFNALLSADDPSHELGVPEYHEPLILSVPDHLHTDFLGRNNYCSAGVSVESDPGYHSR